MLTTNLRFGFVYGMALGTGFFLSYLIIGDTPDTFAKSEAIGYGIMIISSIAVFFGILDTRKNLHPEPMSFFRGLKAGLGITVIAGLMFAVYNLIYLKWLNPTFTETYIAWSEQNIRTSGASQQVIEQQLQELEMYAEMMSNDYLQALVMFITVFLIGAMFSLASAGVLRNNHKQGAE